MDESVAQTRPLKRLIYRLARQTQAKGAASRAIIPEVATNITTHEENRERIGRLESFFLDSQFTGGYRLRCASRA